MLNKIHNSLNFIWLRAFFFVVESRQSCCFQGSLNKRKLWKSFLGGSNDLVKFVINEEFHQNFLYKFLFLFRNFETWPLDNNQCHYNSFLFHLYSWPPRPLYYLFGGCGLFGLQVGTRFVGVVFEFNSGIKSN